MTGVPRTRDDKADRDLFADLAAGDRGALGQIYDRHASSLYRHAVVLSQRQSDAEDLVHAVFLKLATTGAKLRRVRTPASYLHRMLHTTWLDGRRRATTGERALEQATPTAPGGAVGSTDALDISRGLEALPPAQREVIVLHLVEGFSFREVGQLTGVSLFTAAARYRLAIRRLRTLLGDPRSA
jgi:RNA polymerase sigma-70 factor (ECF subfamily)